MSSSKLIECFSVYKDSEYVDDYNSCGIFKGMYTNLLNKMLEENAIKFEFNLRYPDRDGYYSRASIVIPYDKDFEDSKKEILDKMMKHD